MGWILILASFIPSLMTLVASRRIHYTVTASGTAAAVRVAAAGTGLGALAVILGVLLLRFVVIFSAQF